MTSGYMCMKHKQTACVDLGPIPKIPHYAHANVPKSEKNGTETLLGPSILDKG
jgi:hypothetical protein